MEQIIAETLRESKEIKEGFIKKNASRLIYIAEYIAESLKNERKLMLCGNGGSAADAQHIAAEFVNRFQIERPPLPAIALTTDTSIITSVANDYGYEEIFSKQIKAIGAKGDILIALSTSGKSRNVLSAIRAAKDRGIYTIGFLGGDGGDMMNMVDFPLAVENHKTPRIQEVHILIGHLICELVDYILFKKDS